jgi:hypothetical protein
MFIKKKKKINNYSFNIYYFFFFTFKIFIFLRFFRENIFFSPFLRIMNLIFLIEEELLEK